MTNSFEIRMKVSLDGEFGIIVKSESDFESWNGLFGSFIQQGGKVLEQSHQFEHINDDGSLK